MGRVLPRRDLPTAAGLALGAAADLLLADPRRWHPVAGFGRAAAALERALWRDSRAAGTAYAGLLTGAAAALGVLLDRATRGRPAVRTLVTAAATWAVLGGTSLGRAGTAMARTLDAADLPAARALLPTLAGRDPSGLDVPELGRATVESLAENTSDAAVAPLVWGAVAGLPGLLGYRAINTLDAMVGHRSTRHERFGWAAARADDVANWLPARLTAALTVACAPVSGGSAHDSRRIWRRDGAAHPSPNSGRCEAAMAGALGVRLGGRNHYGDRVEDRPFLGDGRSAATADISRAVRLSPSVWLAAVGRRRPPPPPPSGPPGRCGSRPPPSPPSAAFSSGGAGVTDLHHHGDAELAPGLVDLAVNIRAGTPPPWLRAVLHEALDASAGYPDAGSAREAVALLHGRSPVEVLPTAGAAEAFTLVARAVRPRHAVVVHPSFTEPEAALRAAGHPVERLLLDPRDGYRLDPAAVPEDADLVVLGNPTNPTSVLHPAGDVAALARPGRVLLVDEAFADTVPGEPESLAGGPRSPGLLVVRSLTKTWGLAGLRVGYALGPPDLIGAMREQQPHWSVSTPALAALVACSAPDAQAEAADAARELESHRRQLVEALPRAVEVIGRPRSSFVLVRVPDGERVRRALRQAGWAVRRGDTFPGLSADHLRIAVRDPATSRAFTATLAAVLAGARTPPRADGVVLGSSAMEQQS